MRGREGETEAEAEAEADRVHGEVYGDREEGGVRISATAGVMVKVRGKGEGVRG